MIKYPVYQPSLKGKEKKYVLDCLESTWISSKGRFIKEFEDAFAGYVGVRHAASVCNGTAALHVALLALGIGPGDEVIVPTFTYIASVNAISYTGATPVFVDSLADTWQIDPNDVASKVGPRTRAIMAVHLYGHPCEMARLQAIAREKGLFLVEDCAEAIGTRYAGRHVGGFGDIATFSFFGNKTITTGEGGMVVTNDPGLNERSVHIKGQGLAKGREYWHDILGYNYRMTNICAAIGLAQLERVEELVRSKRRVAEWYQKNLAGLPVTVHGEFGPVYHSYWMVSILVENPQLRDPLREYLKSQGVETRPTFSPVHLMPMYSRAAQKYPVAEDLSRRGMNLPSGPDLKESDVREISEAIRRGLNDQRH